MLGSLLGAALILVTTLWARRKMRKKKDAKEKEALKEKLKAEMVAANKKLREEARLREEEEARAAKLAEADVKVPVFCDEKHGDVMGQAEEVKVTKV